MKFTKYTQKLTSIIVLAFISSNTNSAVNIFTPTGGAFTGTQSDALYWDMLSNNAAISVDYTDPSSGTYTGGFFHQK
jgi:hypothetical protein